MAQCKEMTAGRTMPLIFKFALPLLLGNVLQQAYSLIDASIVGKCLGVNALGAVGSSTSVIFLILGFCNGCCCGFAIPVAQRFGARDYSSLRRYVYSSLKLTAVMSLSLALVASLLCACILRWMSTPEEIFVDSYWYLLVTFIGIPATFFYSLLSSIIRALGDSKTPFWFLLGSSVLNVVLDFFCILTLGWGVAGAAIATVFSQALSAVLCYVYMIRKYDILAGTAQERRMDAKYVKKLLSVGVPMGLQFSITAIGSIMLQSANNALGRDCVAAFTAAMRIKMFVICPAESLGIAMSTFAGQNYGAGKPKRVWAGVKSTFVMGMIYVAAISTVLFLFSDTITLLFVDASDTAIIANTVLANHVAATFLPMLALLCNLRYTIQGVGFTNFAMLSGVMEMIARTVVSVVFVPMYGYIAVCYGDSMAWCAACLFLVPAFCYVYGKIKKHEYVSPLKAED